jgi:transcriptional regulator of heat shock response
MLSGMDVLGALEQVVTALRGVQVEHALIGLKVQSSTNDPSRQRLDMADIVRLLRAERNVDMQQVRDYFRVFEREKELDALLAELEKS